jgi:hypothetical protein
MKLVKINYGSAVFFGVAALVMYLVVGTLQWYSRDYLLSQGFPVTVISAFVYVPIAGGIAGYLSILIAIAIYNFVAKKYPIVWEISKK